jgi:hypothetical protein
LFSPVLEELKSHDEDATGKFRAAADNKNANEKVRFKGNDEVR